MSYANTPDATTLRKLMFENCQWLEVKNYSPVNEKPNQTIKNVPVNSPDLEKEKTLYIGGTVWRLPL